MLLSHSSYVKFRATSTEHTMQQMVIEAKGKKKSNGEIKGRKNKASDGASIFSQQSQIKQIQYSASLLYAL